MTNGSRKLLSTIAYPSGTIDTRTYNAGGRLSTEAPGNGQVVKRSYPTGDDHPRSSPRSGGLKKSGEDPQLGRSVGGFSCKIHAACDGLGNPVRFLLTPGQTHDVTQAEALIEGLGAEHVLLDKGYDGNALVATIEKTGAKAEIPSRSNRNEPREYDREVYRERNQIERLFARLKPCRRIATGYEKTARNFMAFLHLASGMIWLA